MVAGRSLATNLAVFWKTSRLYSSGNVAYTQALVNVMDSLTKMFSLEDDFSLQVMGDSLYINELRLKADVVGQASYQYMVDEFTSRNISGIHFSPGVDETEMVRFSETFLAWQPQGDPPMPSIEEFEADLAQREVERLRAIRELMQEIEEEDESQPQRVQARKSFVRAMGATKMAMLAAKRGRRVDLRHAKRAVQSIVDLIISEELSLLGMTTLKDYDEYTYQHCVNVAILSINMGTRLGLSKQQLSQLGVSGLFHDIGKVRIPNAILQKPGKLTPEEWAIMKSHPTEGVKIITKLHGVSSLSMRAMIIAYEHHLNVDLTGYPRLKRRRQQNLFSRIVAISDCFDAMTAHRSYHGRDLSAGYGGPAQHQRAGPGHLSEPEIDHHSDHPVAARRERAELRAGADQSGSRSGGRKTARHRRCRASRSGRSQDGRIEHGITFPRAEHAGAPAAASPKRDGRGRFR
jgi:putative nucleotidyltransferase with HDIG domain